MVLEEQPAKVVEAFRLFLQGNGFGKKINFFLVLFSIKNGTFELLLFVGYFLVKLDYFCLDIFC